MQLDHELALLLLGAAIALLSSIATATVNHVLSLRADRIKRDRDKSETHKRVLIADNLSLREITKRDPRLHIQDVMSPGYGFFVQGALVRILIPRTAQPPCTAAEVLTTDSDNERTFDCKVMASYSGGALATLDESRQIGEVSLDLPKLPERSPLILVFHLNSEGQLSVTLTEPSSGRTVSVRIRADDVAKAGGKH